MSRQPASDSGLAQEISRGIADKRLAVDGRLLPERRLAEMLGVSRVQLRRALDLLERDGLVFRRRGHGTFTTPPAHGLDTGGLQRLAGSVTPQELIDARLAFEPTLAAYAADRATADDIIQLKRLSQATLDAKDHDAYEVADDIFHHKIAEITRNPLMLGIYDSIRQVRKDAAWTRRRKAAYSAAIMAQLAEQHRQLTNSIASHDAAGAATTMEIHILTVSRRLYLEGSGRGGRLTAKTS